MRPPMREGRGTCEHFDADEEALVTDRAKAWRGDTGRALRGVVGLGFGFGFEELTECATTPSE